MVQAIVVGIIGDRDPGRMSHTTTEQALGHAAQVLDVPLRIAWVPTPTLDGPDTKERLAPYDALWCSPGSPYRSASGAHAGIRHAREHDVPFLGT
jgi:CTP synthase (UTP-ammonia lyase)